MKVGRNDPCPCGSGLKYKNCHLRAAGEVPPTERLWQRLHELSQRLPTDLLRFVKSRYGLALVDEAWSQFTLFKDETFDQESIHLPVFMPWFLYASQTVQKGDILFGKLVSVDDLSILADRVPAPGEGHDH